MSDHCDLLCLDLPKAETLRQQRLDGSVAEDAALRAKALADPTRLMLAHALRGATTACVCDLSWIAERSQNLVSHHVQVLRRAGLVRGERDGKMVMYELTPLGEAMLDAMLAEVSA